ncbi:MAG: hypothetical protein A3G35_10270 [candidate division NC10 bacterium RIFCSPLOWO2_12_FULL_66_18]|nr:MAG: hypothetical protein A3G35_10270 [candidate division NC10 bacterium RIFCSPLOWO2_12_FULL_66_18]
MLAPIIAYLLGVYCVVKNRTPEKRREPGTVVPRRVLIGPDPGDPDDLDVDLDRIPRVRLLD